MLSTRILALKHLFFMRECPDFLIEHHYQRKEQLKDLFVKRTLKHTEAIFQS
jgi:hypothetical protein